MRRVIIPLVAAAALAAPGSALAWFGHHHHVALFARLSGTGTSLGGATASTTGTIVAGSPLASGTYGASFSTTWSGATTKTLDNGATLTCAPSNATVVLHDSAAAANTVTGSLSGKTCTFTKSDGTVVHAYFGHGSATGTGSLANLSGLREKAFFMERSDGTVKAVVVVVRAHHEDESGSND
jgi:hypothetical protein